MSKGLNNLKINNKKNKTFFKLNLNNKNLSDSKFNNIDFIKGLKCVESLPDYLKQKLFNKNS